MIKRETIDRIYESIRIEEVIGDFVPLKKAGANYKALSPWSQEKTPSFVVSPAKQIFKDFSTGKGGDAVKFVMEHEHFTYPEALRYLAKKYNIEIQEKEETPEDIKARGKRESLYLINQFARDYFVSQMTEGEGRAVGYSYFAERGFTDETVKEFELGYSPEKRTAFSEEAVSKGYEKEYLVETGLSIERDTGSLFDRFAGRVMFPIHNLSGRVLGFGGRILKSNVKAAKYLNSPESEIYNQSKVLYGLFQSRKEMVSKDNCFLVEGYTDVLRMHQTGVKNVVASSGTALTPDQVRLIKRYTSNITILFDGDPAGIRASFRGIDIILKEGMNVRVTLFPEGEDPDSYASRRTFEKLEEFLAGSEDFIHFKTHLLLEETGGDPVKKGNLIKDILQSIALIPDLITRDLYVKETSRIFEMQEEVLVQELSRIRRKNHNEDFRKDSPPLQEGEMVVVHKETTKVVVDELHVQERSLIELLLKYGDQAVEMKSSEEENYESYIMNIVVEDLKVDQMEFVDPDFNWIYKEYETAYDEGRLLTASEFLRDESDRVQNIIADLLSERHEISKNWEKRGIFPPTIASRLSKDVTTRLLRFKRIKLLNMFKESHELLSKTEELNPSVISYLNQLNKVRAKVNADLGRVV